MTSGTPEDFGLPRPHSLPGKREGSVDPPENPFKKTSDYEHRRGTKYSKCSLHRTPLKT